MYEEEKAFNVILSKIKENGINIIKNNNDKNNSVVHQNANIINTHMVLNYEYEISAMGNYKVRKMSVGYIDALRKNYKPVVKFANDFQKQNLFFAIKTALHVKKK